MSDALRGSIERVCYAALTIWLFVLVLSFGDIHPMSQVIGGAAAYTGGALFYLLLRWVGETLWTG